MEILDISCNYIKSLDAIFSMFIFHIQGKPPAGLCTPFLTIPSPILTIPPPDLFFYWLQVFSFLNFHNDPPSPLEIAQKREKYPQTPFFQGGRGVIMKIKKRKYGAEKKTTRDGIIIVSVITSILVNL